MELNPEPGGASERTTTPGSPVLAVLSYHKIGIPSLGRQPTWYYTPEETFAAHLKTLAAEDWRIVGLEEVLRGLSSPEALPDRAALLTFDDGYRSVLQHVCPMLANLGHPGVAFVPTGYMGATSSFDANTDEHVEPVCSLEELRELEAAGIAVESHAISHRKFSKLSPAELDDELARSKATLEAGLGKTVTALAYPFGDRGDGDVVHRCLERHGYEAAFLYGGGPFPVPFEEAYAVPRIPVGPDTDLALELSSLTTS